MEKETQFFIFIDNKEAGPFTLNNILQQGLTPDTLVWFQGQPNWTKASDIPELNALLDQVAPVTRTPQAAFTAETASAQVIQDLQARLAELERKLAEKEAAEPMTVTPSSQPVEPMTVTPSSQSVEPMTVTPSSQPANPMTVTPSSQPAAPMTVTPPSRPASTPPLKENHKKESDNSSCLKMFLILAGIAIPLIFLAFAINECNSTTSNQHDYDSVCHDSVSVTVDGYQYEDVKEPTEAAQEAAPAEDYNEAVEAAKAAEPVLDEAPKAVEAAKEAAPAVEEAPHGSDHTPNRPPDI